MADLLTEDQLTEFKRVFLLFDEEGNGTMSTKMLGTAMRALGLNPTSGELEEMIENFNFDFEHGIIDFVCFLDMLSRQMEGRDSEEETREVFKVFDKDGKGFITAAELRHIMGESLSEIEDEPIAEVDVDGDGKISYENFVGMMLGTSNISTNLQAGPGISSDAFKEPSLSRALQAGSSATSGGKSETRENVGPYAWGQGPYVVDIVAKN